MSSDLKIEGMIYVIAVSFETICFDTSLNVLQYDNCKYVNAWGFILFMLVLPVTNFEIAVKWLVSIIFTVYFIIEKLFLNISVL